MIREYAPGEFGIDEVLSASPDAISADRDGMHASHRTESDSNSIIQSIGFSNSGGGLSFHTTVNVLYRSRIAGQKSFLQKGNSNR